MTGRAERFDATGVWAVFDGTRGVLEPAVEKLLVALAESNRAQWDAEDRARGATAPAEVAMQKASIDRLNAGRMELILALDRLLHHTLAPVTSAPPTTDTPGSVCDRLSILHLRESRLVEASSRAEVRAQSTELRWAFDVMLTDVREGKRSFTVRQPNKLYGTGERACSY